MYVIGMNPRAGGYGIWKRINNNDWQEIGGGAVRIDVDDKGVPWVINSIGEIFKREGDNWRCMPGRANDIGIGGDGSVWIIGTNIQGQVVMESGGESTIMIGRRLVGVQYVLMWMIKEFHG